MSAPNLRQPLTMEDCALLDKVLSSIPEALEFARKLSDCGLDCQRHIDTLRAQQSMAQRFKAKFFPECP